MSTFNETPIVVGHKPTTYGELRFHAQQTHDQTTASDVSIATLLDPELSANAIRGMATTILFLVDTIEELTRKETNNSV